MHFPRLSPDPSAAHVCGEGLPRTTGGDPTIVVDGQVVSDGLSPVWLTPTVVLFARGTHLVTWDLERRALSVLQSLARPVNKVEANGRGRWVAWHGAEGPNGEPPGYTAWDKSAEATDNWPGLDLEGRIFTCGPREQHLRCTEAGMGWIAYVSAGARPQVRPVDRWGMGESYWSVPVMTPRGACCLCVEAARLVLRLGATGTGWVLASGEPTYHPDARWDGQQVRWVATDRDGDLMSRRLDILTLEPVALTPEPPPPPVARPKITIPSYEPTDGVAPLAVTVRVVAEAGSGPITATVVTAQSTTGPVIVVTREASTLPDEVVLDLTVPGTYRLTARATGPGGTGGTSKVREVTVTAPAAPPPPPVPDREAFLLEAETFPATAVHREALGYAWARLVDGLSAPQAHEYVWPGQSGGGDPIGPLPADPRRWRGNFLAFPGYPLAFMYPAWPTERRTAFRAAYRAAGYTHLPIGIWGSYGDQGTFDFRRDPGGFAAVLQELRGAGIEPCVMVHTDAVAGRHAWSRAALTDWARGYLPHVQHLVRLWCTGWEFNQIDQKSNVYWCGNGDELLAWARDLRGILGSAATLYVHFSPERITGWPHYPNHDGPQDEPGWWQPGKGGAAEVLDGILYQRPPDEDERWTLAHTIGGVGEDGSTDIGDVHRIAGPAWGLHGLDFVCFEFARDPERHARLSAEFLQHPLVAGVC